MPMSLSVIEIKHLLLYFVIYAFTDINECNSTDNGGCHHICSNTPGGYNCSCNDGFTMLGENDTCVGK